MCFSFLPTERKRETLWVPKRQGESGVLGLNIQIVNFLILDFECFVTLRCFSFKERNAVFFVAIFYFFYYFHFLYDALFSFFIILEIHEILVRDNVPTALENKQQFHAKFAYSVFVCYAVIEDMAGM